MKVTILWLIIVCYAISLFARPYSSVPRYLEITGFSDDSVIHHAGAMVGDVIVKYDNTVINELHDLKTARDKTSEDSVMVVLKRNGEEINLKIPKGTLGVMCKEYLPEYEVLPDSRILEGYGKLVPGTGMSNSFLACIAMMEQKIGAKTEYRDLVGLSGYGFRVQVTKGLYPSAPDACSGKNTGLSILKTLGYSSNSLFLLNKESKFTQADPQKIPALRTVVKNSIDAGYPVIAIDMIDMPKWGLIIGYQNDCAQYWCRTFYDETKGPEIAQKEPWEVYAITGYRAVDLQSSYRKSLKTALEMYKTKKYKGNFVGDAVFESQQNDGYYSGLAAYRYWIEQLADEKAFKEMSGNDRDSAQNGNLWTYKSLLDARQFCAEYLTANKERFGVEVAKIEALANVYQEEADLLRQHLKEIPGSTGNAPRGWTQKDRNNQIEVLRSMQALEESAYGILKSM